MKTDINRYLSKNAKNIYNIKTKDNSIKKEIGLNEEIVKNISKEKGEPSWVLDIRLKALKFYVDIPPYRYYTIDRKSM